MRRDQQEHVMLQDWSRSLSITVRSKPNTTGHSDQRQEIRLHKKLMLEVSVNFFIYYGFSNNIS